MPLPEEGCIFITCRPILAHVYLHMHMHMYASTSWYTSRQGCIYRKRPIRCHDMDMQPRRRIPDKDDRPAFVHGDAESPGLLFPLLSRLFTSWQKNECLISVPRAVVKPGHVCRGWKQLQGFSNLLSFCLPGDLARNEVNVYRVYRTLNGTIIRSMYM